MRHRPLPSSFILIGLFGFAASVIYMSTGALSLTWGILSLLFSIVLVAAALHSLEL